MPRSMAVCGSWIEIAVFSLYLRPNRQGGGQQDKGRENYPRNATGACPQGRHHGFPAAKNQKMRGSRTPKRYASRWYLATAASPVRRPDSSRSFHSFAGTKPDSFFRERSTMKAPLHFGTTCLRAPPQ